MLINREFINGLVKIITRITGAAGIKIKIKSTFNSITYYTGGKFSTIIGVF